MQGAKLYGSDGARGDWAGDGSLQVNGVEVPAYGSGYLEVNSSGC